MRLFFLLLILFAVPSYAEDSSYGLAMHGAPKYTAGDTHLTYANPSAPKGGTLHHSAIGTFDTLNPYTIKGKAAQGLGLTTDRLMARIWDEPFTMYPLIAKSYKIADDRSWISFEINPAARFHDGSPITVADIKFSFETLRDFGRPNQRRIYKLVKNVDTTDTSITFTFGEGYDQETALIIAMMPILSKSYWADKTFDETTLNAPLGSGPYKVASIDAGRRITYERVKDYWANDHLTRQGLHNFDNIIYDYFRDDGVALEAFKSGETNIRRENNIARWNSAYDIPAVASGEIVKLDLPHQRPEKARGLIFNTRRAPFDDIRVRQALDLMLDKEWINTNLFFGQYKEIQSYYPNSELAAPKAPKTTQTARQKIREANRLLTEAGWTIENGKRVKDGQPFTFEILLNAPQDEKIALHFKRALAKAGIEARPRVLDTAAYRGRLNEYDFDMTLYHWLSSLSPGTEQILYFSCESGKQQGRWNFPGICDPNIDALAASIAQSKNRKDLITAVHTLDEKLIEGHYMIPLFYKGSDSFAIQNTIKYPAETPLYGAVLETWWMDNKE